MGRATGCTLLVTLRDAEESVPTLLRALSYDTGPGQRSQDWIVDCPQRILKDVVIEAGIVLVRRVSLTNMHERSDMDPIKPPQRRDDEQCFIGWLATCHGFCHDLHQIDRSTSILPEKYMKQQPEQSMGLLGTEALVISAMRHKYDDPQPLAPVTNFIGSLWGKLAINDKSLEPLADGFRLTNTYPNSGELAFRRWKLAELATPFMVDNVRRGFIPNSDWQYLY